MSDRGRTPTPDCGHHPKVMCPRCSPSITDPPTVDMGRYRTPPWLVVLHEFEQREGCICGGRRGHAGWLICAEREVQRLDASLAASDDASGTTP